MPPTFFLNYVTGRRQITNIKSIDGCLKYFFLKKLYVEKHFENFYVCMHHGPV